MVFFIKGLCYFIYLWCNFTNLAGSDFFVGIAFVCLFYGNIQVKYFYIVDYFISIVTSFNLFILLVKQATISNTTRVCRSLLIG